MAMFDPAVETLPRDQLRTLQSERLAALLAYVYDRMPFYREQFDRAGVKPADIGGVEDLPRLPFTTKADLRDHYPFGMLAVPQERLLRVHASSGTTGKPTVVAYTRGDIDVFAEVNARSMAAGGARPGMLLHNAYGYGLFTGGLGLHYGGERLGMVVVPASGGVTERQITLIQDFKPAVIASTPSYAQTLAEEFRRRGVAPEEISLQYAILGAEPWTDTIRAHVDAGLGVRSTNIYGLSEVIGPGVSQECLEGRAGSHVWEDHFLVEVVDPETGEPLPDGEQGELVFTTLTKEAMPVIRYRSGDLSYLTHEPCACGRTHVRMGPIRGRTDDMLIVRGVNIYPTQIEEILAGIPQVVPLYELVITRIGTLDDVEVKVEVAEDLYHAVGQKVLSSEVLEADQRLRALRNEIVGRIRETLGLRTTVTLLAPGAAPRSEGGKLRRVTDLREL